jgi:hypothetical protein
MRTRLFVLVTVVFVALLVAGTAFALSVSHEPAPAATTTAPVAACPHDCCPGPCCFDPSLCPHGCCPCSCCPETGGKSRGQCCSKVAASK